MWPKSKPPDTPPPAAPDKLDLIRKELAHVVCLLDAMSARLVRSETRLCVLMRQHGLDTHGNPID